MCPPEPHIIRIDEALSFLSRPTFLNLFIVILKTMKRILKENKERMIINNIEFLQKILINKNHII